MAVRGSIEEDTIDAFVVEGLVDLMLMVQR